MPSTTTSVFAGPGVGPGAVVVRITLTVWLPSHAT